MAAVPEQSFDGAAAIFNEHAQTLRGYVRYHVIQANLEHFLNKTPMRVLDVGGGSGIDAAWLAVKGHSITFLEASKVQCDAAEARFNFFLTKTERKRIKMMKGGFKDLSKEDDKYDLLLMHGVAMYQPDPATFIKTAAGFLKKNGLFSLVEKGYYGAQARAIRRSDEEQLKTVHDAHVYLNRMQLNATTFKPEELELFLQAAGVTVTQWGGVRVITDDMFEDVAAMDQATLSQIVKLEYEQGQHPGIRAQGQMLHFIGHKQ